MQLSRAAGQLADITIERLRRDLEAFSGRQIRKNGVGEVVDRKPAPDRDRRRLDAVGSWSAPLFDRTGGIADKA